MDNQEGHGRKPADLIVTPWVIADAEPWTFAQFSNILSEVFHQVNGGKGRKRHGIDGKGELLNLDAQPWAVISKNLGTPAFCEGQALKKLMEATARAGRDDITSESYEREMIGAMVYIVFSLMYRRNTKDAPKKET